VISSSKRGYYTYGNITICLFLLCLAASGPVQSSGHYAATDLPSNKSISFELVDGLIIVQASYSGVSGNFVLDTGAPTVLLNQVVKEKDFDLWTPGGTSGGKEIRVNGFRFGHIQRDQIEGWAMDLSFLERKINLPIAGIVGNEIWGNQQIIIDFNNQVITFHQKGDKLKIRPDNYDVAILPWKSNENQQRVISLELGGVERMMTFDTGAGITVLDAAISLEDSHQSNAKVDHITILDLPFIQSDLSSLQSSTHTEEIDGILSATSLQADIVVLDFANDRLLFCWEKDSL